MVHVDEAYRELAGRIGRRLRRARREAGLTGTELGRLIGKSQAFISDVERGRKLPSLPTLVALSNQLHRSAEFFMGESDDERERSGAEDQRLWPPPLEPGRVPLSNGFGRRLAREVGQVLAEKGLTWKDLADRVSGGFSAALRIKQGFLPPREVVIEVTEKLGCEPSRLLVAAGYLPESVLDRELWEAMSDSEIQALALKIAREFPTPRSRQFVLQMIESAKALAQEAASAKPSKGR
ncbi:MAG TPA: helix-turn-helix transcriptional regulator [Limnochordia bacterium]